MKKIIAMLLMCSLMLVSLVACTTPENSSSESQSESESESTPNENGDVFAKSEGTMTYEEYAAAELDTPVVVEAFVQATQSWWDNKISVYAQDDKGGYFFYNMTCAEADAASLVPGTKIKVTGMKAAWSGEIEVVDATFEIMEGTYIAEATDLTSILANEDELVKHQNQFASFKGLTVEGIEFQNGSAGVGNDIYVTVSLDGASYSFCVEAYLTNPETETYTTASTLQVGDKIDVEGFVYWYNGVNTHMTKITKK